MRLLFAALLVLCCLTLNAQEPSILVTLAGDKAGTLKQSSAALSDTTLRLSVTNMDETPYEHLKPEDVTIMRNGNATEILRLTPLVESQYSHYKVILCLDNSTSMDRHADRLLGIIDTLLSCFSLGGNITAIFFHERLSDIPQNDRATFSLNNDPLKISVREFGNHFDAVKKYCKTIYESGLQPRTYLWDQVYAGFLSAASGQFTGEDVFIIILSDGEDNASTAALGDVLTGYKQGKIYAINFSHGSNKSLQELAQRTNGMFFEAEDAETLAQRFAQIRKHIVFSGYEITFKEFFPPEISSEGFYEIKSSQYRSVNKMAIEEVNSREFFPLLNYVFFDKNSDTLAPKYTAGCAKLKRSSTPFAEQKLPPLQLEIYNNLLNVIGSRMQQYPEARITLVGCNDNDGVEKNKKELSKRRAEAVRRFIIDEYGIDSLRIAMKMQNLPQKASAAKIASGMEENRRVEIYADDDRILDPVEVIAATKVSDPANLTVNLKIRNSTPVKEWELAVLQGENEIMKTGDKGLPPLNYSWNVGPSIFDKKLDGSDFKFVMSVKDQRGLVTKTTVLTMPVTYVSSERKKAEVLADKTIEKLSLVLFDFNSAKLDARNQNMLKRIENYIQPTSILKMNGYTDSIGTEPLNAKLSQGRAENSMKELVRLLHPQTTELQSEGYGELAPLYDNGLPEGRFYNRTCQLVIETPVAEKSPWLNK